MGLFCTGSDDVIVACVREVIDQLNQVSIFSMENGGINFNPHSKDRIPFCSKETFSWSTQRGCCHQHGRGVEFGIAVVQFLLASRVYRLYTQYCVADFS